MDTFPPTCKKSDFKSLGSQLRALATKADNVSSLPRAHVIERERPSALHRFSQRFSKGICVTEIEVPKKEKKIKQFGESKINFFVLLV